MSHPKHPSREAFCATCRRPLVAVNEYDGAGALIQERFEHPSGMSATCPNLVPIDVDGRSLDQVSVCDFCHASGVTMEFTAEEFVVPGNEFNLMGELWLACPECAADVEAENWRGVIARWSTNVDMVIDSALRDHVLGIFRQFSLNRRGAPRLV